jgi:hypothetical protein
MKGIHCHTQHPPNRCTQSAEQRNRHNNFALSTSPRQKSLFYTHRRQRAGTRQSASNKSNLFRYSQEKPIN